MTIFNFLWNFKFCLHEYEGLMFVAQHYNVWFCIDMTRQFTFRCNVKVQDAYFNKSHSYLQAVSATHGENQRKYIIFDIDNIFTVVGSLPLSLTCHNLLNAHLPIPGHCRASFAWTTQVLGPHMNQTFSCCTHNKVLTWNIPHPWPAVYELKCNARFFENVFCLDF